MSGVTVEQLAGARAAAAAAVRISATGQVSVRMPRLGSVRHGTDRAALAGCPCRPCDQVREQLTASVVPEPPEVTSGEPATAPIPPAAAVPPAGRVPVAVPVPPSAVPSVVEVALPPVVDEPDLVPLVLPAGLTPDLPEGVDGIAGARARRVVLAHSGGDDAVVAAELLLMLGLATDPTAAGNVAGTAPTPPAHAPTELQTAEVA